MIVVTLLTIAHEHRECRIVVEAKEYDKARIGIGVR